MPDRGIVIEKGRVHGRGRRHPGGYGCAAHGRDPRLFAGASVFAGIDISSGCSRLTRRTITICAASRVSAKDVLLVGRVNPPASTQRVMAALRREQAEGITQAVPFSSRIPNVCQPLEYAFTSGCARRDPPDQMLKRVHPISAHVVRLVLVRRRDHLVSPEIHDGSQERRPLNSNIPAIPGPCRDQHTAQENRRGCLAVMSMRSPVFDFCTGRAPASLKEQANGGSTQPYC